MTTHNTTTTELPTPVIEAGITTPIGASTLITAVRAMPETTVEETAAKWLKAKEIESAGSSAKSIRSALGDKLAVEFELLHESRIVVNGQSYKFTEQEGMSSGITSTAIEAFKARYARMPYIGRALDQAINACKSPFKKRGLTLG